jgi:hypothetical protein
VTKLRQLQGTVAAVLLASVLFGILVASSTTAGAATASAQFCSDSAQLQGWIAQNEQPGLDQYDYDGYPDLSVIQPEANYLEKLNAEAPSSTQPAFSEWANFAKAVADTTAKAVAEGAAAPPGLTSWPALASQDQQATFAAGLVEEWMHNGSGCKQLYVTLHDPPASSGHHGINPLWWVAGAVVILLIIGGAIASAGDDATASPSPKTVDTGRGRAPQPTYDFSPKEQTISCDKCSGTGRMTCYRCGGSGRLSNGAEFGGTADAYRICEACSGQTRITCDGCGGSGKKTVYR